MKKGKFITFEGCEGVGKSTQVSLLRQYLDQRGIQALFLREPGGSSISEDIRRLILSTENVGMTGQCEALLYAASRAQLIGQIIEPALAQGKLVVCDRFTDSTFAYQGVARGLGEDYVDCLNRLACGDVIPDLTIFLDLEPQAAFLRKGGADKNDRMEQEKEEFHLNVYRGYKIACDRYKDRIVAIDASASKEQVHAAIVDALIQRDILDD
ncbi:MAG: dTMP kinase [Christensenellales bacterium]